MQDTARFLLFSAHQQQQQQDAGLTAQLNALRLRCMLQAEQLQALHPNQQLLAGLSGECSRLLAGAGASQQVADARAARCAAATAAAGGQPLQLPQGLNLVSINAQHRSDKSLSCS
jgi:hypothetical protein